MTGKVENMRHPFALEPLFENVVRRLRGRHFHALAESLRERIPSVLTRWREESVRSIPGIDQLTIEEFEDSIAALLNALADAMETDDPAQLRSVIEKAPLHGADRIAQEYSIDALLTEGSILRSSIVAELREQMHGMLNPDEAEALHELIDLVLEYSTLEFIRLRMLHRDVEMARQVSGIRRLANLGTLVAGVAHDASNLLLPARMGLDRLRQCRLDDEARKNLQLVERVFQHFQNTIVNLRWLSVDTARQHHETAPLDLHEFVQQYRDFLVSMLPHTISLEVKVPQGLPPVRITAAALSQVIFNLVRNAQEAINAHEQRGRLLLLAEHNDEHYVDVVVEDDGPGMPSEAREHCFEPFTTTKTGENSGGLGLSVVDALVSGFGGSIDIRSPALNLDTSRGTAFVLHLPAATPAPTLDPA